MKMCLTVELYPWLEHGELLLMFIVIWLSSDYLCSVIYKNILVPPLKWGIYSNEDWISLP